MPSKPPLPGQNSIGVAAAVLGVALLLVLLIWLLVHRGAPVPPPSTPPPAPPAARGPYAPVYGGGLPPGKRHAGF